jgi:hypothetical protein
MSARSQSLYNESRLSWNRIASIIAWLIGVLFTYLVLAAAAPDLGWLWVLIIALGGQLLLTIAEKPLWKWILRRKGGKLVVFGVGVTLIDGGINAGGIYPYVPRLADTSIGKMLIEVFELSPKISTPAAALLALAFGLLIAGLAEYLWELE